MEAVELEMTKSGVIWRVGSRRLVTYGHSWVKGRYPNRWVTPWPRRAALRVGAVLQNEGFGGAESPQILERLVAVEPRPQDIVIIEAMLNDVRRFGGDDQGVRRYAESLASMLSSLSTPPSCPLHTLVLCDPEILAWGSFSPHDKGSAAARRTFCEATYEVARDFERVDVLDINAGWEVRACMSADGVHPNGHGTAYIAELVLGALRSSAYR